MESKICMNMACGTSMSIRWHKGWILQSGAFVLLCDNCSSIYEQSTFCDVFHSNEPGWRPCSLCGKRFHCGCIASKSLLELRDSGGISCKNCLKNSRLEHFSSTKKGESSISPAIEELGSNYESSEPTKSDMKVKDAYESLSMSPNAPPFGNSISNGEKEQSKSSKSEKNVIMASPIQVARPSSAMRRPKNHIYPRYLPKITHQELQQLSGQLKSTIVPLFEKTLTVSDVGRLGRMVLPKPCVETYFPPISQPEGISLQIEDVKGNKLVFRFRFWPNNSSRIYLLEGVHPWIRSMQLQAGDFVTFSRTEPGEKLIIWFRKASISSKQSLKESEETTLNVVPENVASESDDDMSLHDIFMSKGMKRGLPQQELVVHEKKRACDIDSKSKRLQLIDNQDSLMLKLTWEEVQGFLQPSPTVIPNIVVIDDHVFEEYDEPPIIAKKGIFINGMNEQWIQCDLCSEWKKLEGCVENLCDQTRCSCSASMNRTG